MAALTAFFVSILCEFHTWKVRIPIVLRLIPQHGQHLRHRLVYTLYASVSVQVVCACRDFTHAQMVENDDKELGAEPEAVIRQDTREVAP